jgi:hypothetical protein
VLSNGNLEASSPANPGGNPAVRATTSKTTGKFYYEATMLANDQHLYNTVGVATKAAAITNAMYSGGAGAGVASQGAVYVNNSNVGAISNSQLIEIQTFSIAVDLTAQLFWARVNGGAWNGSPTANPATGVGGYDISGAGSINNQACAPALSSSTTTMDVLANFGATPYSFQPPSGFNNWS